MLIFAFVFYKERVIFTDLSFHLFCILKDKSLAIQNNRFGAIITQIFPFMCAKYGMSLKTATIVYSICFVFIYSSVFWILIQLFKNRQLALAYLLLNTLIATHSFYWVQSELPQGLAIFFVYLGLLLHVLKKDIVPQYFYWLSSVLLFTVCFTHPLLIFASTFSFLFLMLSYSSNRKLIAYGLLTYLTFYVIKSIFFSTTYDSQAMSGLKNISSLLPHFFELKSTKNLGIYLLHDYYFLIPCLLIVTIFYLATKEWLKLVLVFCYTIGYLVIVNISYSNGAEQYYIENQYSLLAFFICVPLAFDILIRYNKIALIFIVLVATVGLWRMYNAHVFYTNRLAWERGLLEKTKLNANPKIIIKANIVPQEKLLMTWGSSYEFWLLSTLENNHSRSVIIEENNNEFDWALGNNKTFITKWGTFDYNTLDERYFKFTDTSYYVKMDTNP
jgi:hypothetical protein